LVKKGILTRLESGLYNIVPFESGHAGAYLGNPYVVARELVFKKTKSEKANYYLSHGSAMEIHQMVTQPQFVVYTTVSKQIKTHPTILGTEFRFVTTKEDQCFGVEKHWVEKSEMVLVSDIEKTIIDGLKLPEYCGGITEVAKGLWIKKNKISPEKLVEYAFRIDKGVIYRRLGFILETYQMADDFLLQKLQDKINKKHLLLDPTLIDEGHYNAKWKLRLNILEDELKTVIRT
jgi:predicted transcriptional regulator of viral defense system